MASPRLRRTRFVCISDTHNSTVKLPEGDVLIHAGDLTNQGNFSELSKTVKWLEEADFEAKIVIAGNHDITLDQDFYPEHGLYFHNQNPQSTEECVKLLTQSPSITYLNHDSDTIRLTSPTGPHTQFTIFGSPYSPRHGLWAFYYDAPAHHTSHSELTSLWELMPLDTDIVVTHTPSRTHCDETDERRATGCEALRQALWRVRPKLAVCGHIHSGRGAQRVTWDLGCHNVRYKEKEVVRWEDPGEGNQKISLVDLTGRKAPSLVNDGSHPGRDAALYQGLVDEHLEQEAGTVIGKSPRRHSGVTFTSDSSISPEDRQSAPATSKSFSQPNTFGLGGSPESGRSDAEALAGRMGRQETCVVNAAIMKSKYPHIGGKQFYKPIVVDLDLPVWDDDE